MTIIKNRKSYISKCNHYVLRNKCCLKCIRKKRFSDCNKKIRNETTNIKRKTLISIETIDNLVFLEHDEYNNQISSDEDEDIVQRRTTADEMVVDVEENILNENITNNYMNIENERNTTNNNNNNGNDESVTENNNIPRTDEQINDLYCANCKRRHVVHDSNHDIHYKMLYDLIITERTIKKHHYDESSVHYL